MARRSGLGRGLGALIPTEIPGQARSALREVPIGSIRPNGRQPRTYFDEEAMASLAASIRELGVLQPVLVKEIAEEPDAYELIAGERRWRAARRAGLQTIPVLAQAQADDAQSLEQALVENLHREDLNPLEEAAAYQQLIDDFSFTHEQVAKRVGKSRAAVTNTLRLLQLPAGVQRALADATITAGHARALLGTPDRALQEALVARVISEGLTVRAVEDEVRVALERVDAANAQAGIGATTGTTRRTAGRRRLPEPGLLELEELLAAFLNTRVKVDLKNKKGRLVIEFATLEDLERIYRTMVGPEPG
jgi:ParB family transcriptional regulator, chromosome partitioning protein